MKRLNIAHNALIGIITIAGLLHANPPAIEVFNLSDTKTLFTLTLVPDDGKSAAVTKPLMVEPSTTDNPATQYTAPGRNTIKSIRITNTSSTLNLEQYSEKIGIVYNGSVLMEESAYKLYKTSRAERAQHRIATLLTALYTGFASGLTSMQQWWQRWRRSNTSPQYPNALQYTIVYNELPFAVEVNGGGYIQPIGLKNSDVGNSTTFSKTIDQLDVYQPNLAHPGKSEFLRIINLNQKINHWKPGHNLAVTITQPTWYDKLLRHKISYSLTWQRDIPPQTPEWALEPTK